MFMQLAAMPWRLCRKGSIVVATCLSLPIAVLEPEPGVCSASSAPRVMWVTDTPLVIWMSSCLAKFVMNVVNHHVLLTNTTSGMVSRDSHFSCFWLNQGPLPGNICWKSAKSWNQRPELDLANPWMNRGDPFSDARPIGNEVMVCVLWELHRKEPWFHVLRCSQKVPAWVFICILGCKKFGPWHRQTSYFNDDGMDGVDRACAQGSQFLPQAYFAGDNRFGWFQNSQVASSSAAWLPEKTHRSKEACSVLKSWWLHTLTTSRKRCTPCCKASCNSRKRSWFGLFTFAV